MTAMSDTPSNWTCRSDSVDTTLAIGAAVARVAQAGDVIALSGELGAGKTQFVRGLADGLGIGRDCVTSPTFVMCQEYDAVEKEGLRLVHIDAYRLEGTRDAESIGWDDSQELRRDAVVAIEWADRLTEVLGDDRLDVLIKHVDEQTRRFTITPTRHWRSRWRSLVDTLDRAISANEPTAAPSPCPVCGKDVLPSTDSYPFCNKRCRLIDLGRWLNGNYVISRPIELSDIEESD